MTNGDLPIRVLPTLDPSAGPSSHPFSTPSKRIHESNDVSSFLTSKAYVDIMTFLLQLNRSMFPLKNSDGSIQSWELNSEAVEFSAPVRRLQQLLTKLEEMLEKAPPDQGPRRFGNVAFRRWFQIVEGRADELLEGCLAPEVLEQGKGGDGDGNGTTAKEELKAYFLGSWGSAQRLDYGTGHELSFLAFLGGIWKLNGFPKTAPGVEERAIVLGIVQPYLELIRTIIKRYTLEPAGSHGVWGLDDHSFLPYIFGAAQFAPAVACFEPLPEEGSLPDAPDPGGVAKANIVERERKTNMYFSAVGFIYDVKRGPFWEHSPMLYDISGIRTGWAKINKGMIKMYNAEVLSKFPVVQHFPFGSLFSFERDLNVITPQTQPQSQPPTARPAARSAGPGAGTKAPWSTGAPAGGTAAPTAAPWATSRVPPSASSSLPDTSRLPPGPMAPTRAPWAKPPAGPTGDPGDLAQTKAPWAN